MITANIATYPPRQASLLEVIKAVSPQVDRLNVVLNEYDSPIDELKSYQNVVQILPDHDTKDCGKFYPDTRDSDYVFFIDDDVYYPNDFVAMTIKRFDSLPLKLALAGYYTSIYVQPRFALTPSGLKNWVLSHSKRQVARSRYIIGFNADLDEPVIVDQVATNAAVMKGDAVPNYEYMRTSQKFVDVRLAKWCFENGITSVALPRVKGWLSGLEYRESIYRSFTRKNFSQPADEIHEFAFKRSDVGRPLRTGAT